MRVLVIDDDDATARAVGLMLKNLGHESVLADSALRGIALAESERFDVAITDMNMPALDGLEAVKALAHMRPPVAVIGMSGGSIRSAPEDYGELALHMGAHVFLSKPFRQAQLEAAIATAVGRAGGG